MSVQWNDDVNKTLREMVRRTQKAVTRISSEYSGRPLSEVREALASAWAESNDGASITEPDLTNVSRYISAGVRVWIEDDGRIMADD